MPPPFSCARRRAPRAPTGDLLYPLHQGCQVGRFPLRGKGRDGCACGRSRRRRAGDTGGRWLSGRRGASAHGAAYSPGERTGQKGERRIARSGDTGQTRADAILWQRPAGMCPPTGRRVAPTIEWGALRSDVYRGEGLAATFMHGAALRYGGLDDRAIAPPIATTPISYDLWTQETDESPASELADRWAARIIGASLAQAGFVPRPLCAPNRAPGGVCERKKRTPARCAPIASFRRYPGPAAAQNPSAVAPRSRKGTASRISGSCVIAPHSSQL